LPSANRERSFDFAWVDVLQDLSRQKNLNIEYSALLAGLARLPYPSFLFWNAAGGCLWALTFGWLGATFGSQWPLVARGAGRVGVLIVGLLGVCLDKGGGPGDDITTREA
jgi:hypothetical protein